MNREGAIAAMVTGLTTTFAYIYVFKFVHRRPRPLVVRRFPGRHRFRLHVARRRRRYRYGPADPGAAARHPGFGRGHSHSRHAKGARRGGGRDGTAAAVPDLTAEPRGLCRAPFACGPVAPSPSERATVFAEAGHIALALALVVALLQATLPMWGAHRADARLMALGDVARRALSSRFSSSPGPR